MGLFAQDVVSPGTTGNGLFYGGGTGLLVAQAIGVLAVGAFVFTAAWIFWSVLKATVGIRVKLHEEIVGLDLSEHGNMAYPEFVTRKSVPVMADVADAVTASGKG